MVPGQILYVCAKIIAVTGIHPSWAMLEFKVGKAPKPSFLIWGQIRQNFYICRKNMVLLPFFLFLVLEDGELCNVTNAVKIHIKIISFSWNHEFKILNGHPFLAILDLDFLHWTCMVVDIPMQSVSLWVCSWLLWFFCYICYWYWECWISPDSWDQVLGIFSACATGIFQWIYTSLLADFQGLLTSNLGMVKCPPYESEPPHL